MRFVPLLLLLTLAPSACSQPEAPDPAPTRTMAVTIDDLPLAGAQPPGARCDAAFASAFTERMIEAITAAEVPAIGFVNERTDCPEIRDDLLRLWLDAGLELGNHTSAHTDINDVSVDSFGVQIALGEAATRPLMAEFGHELRYFRHPYLHTGDTPDKKAGLDSLLAARGYTVAPVTVDSDEWIWAHSYAMALQRDDTEMQARLRSEYVDWMEGIVAHFEGRAQAVVGRDIPHVLLIHANALATDTFAELAARLRARGYTFVPLEEALADPVYRQPDPYVGPWGISWLHRWADAIAWEPDAPEWVNAYRQN
ncbi:MAG: polysaccharide deacetylase family protein [Rubricoccaceae bacterium]